MMKMNRQCQLDKQITENVISGVLKNCMIDNIKSILIHPLLRKTDIDAPETVACVAEVIQGKSFLKKVYQRWYAGISKLLPHHISGPVLELGAGAGFLEQYIPNLIKSEILQTPITDIVLDAHHLPFTGESLRGIVMLDVLHHLPDGEAFFHEAAHCIKPGGVIVMIEPWVTQWSKLIYGRLHHEPFEENVKEWKFPKGGPLSQANSAMPWIIFDRDRSVFIRKFPEWKIKIIELHTPFAYLISGGVSLRNLLPGFAFSICSRLEEKMNSRMNFWAMFATIALEKLEL